MADIRILLVPLGSVEPVNKLSEKDTMIRMREALARWQSREWDYLLVTGGAFTSKKIMTIAGAWVMQRWFLEQGVPKDKIIVEYQFRDSYQNVEFSLRKLQQWFTRGYGITVITQWQHAIRFWLTFRAYGVTVSLKKLYYWINQTFFRQNR